GMPVLLPPPRGTSSEATDFGQIVHEPLPPWRTTYGTPSLGADRALSSAENLPKLADTSLQWRPRDPARRPGRRGPGRSPDEGAAHGGLSLSRGGLERWGHRATLAPALLGTAPAAGPAHRRYAMAQAPSPGGQRLPDAGPDRVGLCRGCPAGAHPFR